MYTLTAIVAPEFLRHDFSKVFVMLELKVVMRDVEGAFGLRGAHGCVKSVDCKVAEFLQ